MLDPTPAARADPALSAREQAILDTIAYRDLFDFPVSDREIHRYLQGQACTLDEVRECLTDPGFRDHWLASDGENFALAGRDELFAVRRRRAEFSRELWPRALSYARLIASVPFVRMIAVTGSVAVDNADRDADIDFMVVFEGGRLWSSRLVVKILQYSDRVVSAGEMCVNYMLTTRALELPAQNLYVAQELVQMIPVYGFDVYGQLRAANTWTDRFLPNSGGAPRHRDIHREYLPRGKTAAEYLLRSPPGRWIERWESRRKLHKYNETAFLTGRYSASTPEATGHRRFVGRRIIDALGDRRRTLLAEGRPLRVLVGQAYHLAFDPKLWRAMQPFPPLGALYAAAVVRELGHVVRVHDSMLAQGLSEWRTAVRINRPDVVVLYEDNFNYLTKMCLANMRAAAIEMIEAARKCGAQVFVCSSDASDEPAVYLDAGARAVLKGEGEETLRELIAAVANDPAADLGSIAGVVTAGPDGKPAWGPARQVIRHVDELPMPAWDLIDLDQYVQIWQRRHGYVAINLVTTRGCPYHCNWCAKPIWGQRYNARTPANVAAELEWLARRMPLEHVWFMDDIFGLKPGWVARFAAALESSDTSIRFKALSRPDLLLRRGEVEALARAGCDVVWMGAESGSQDVLDAMEKGTTVGDIHEACRRLRANGIRIGLFIQFGYPGESMSDIDATVAMLREIMPDELGISVSYPLPGTRFHERVAAELGAKRHWDDSDDLAMLFRGPYNTAFYRHLHRFVHYDLALRRAWRNRAAVSGTRRLRRLAFLPWAATRVLFHRTAMAALARLPHHGTGPLPVELAPPDAATPSPQDEA